MLLTPIGQVVRVYTSSNSTCVVLLPAVEDCFVEADAKGVEYVWAAVKEEGRPAAEVRGVQGGAVLWLSWSVLFEMYVNGWLHGTLVAGCVPSVLPCASPNSREVPYSQKMCY